MRILFVTKPVYSHVTKFVPLARALTDLGHDVAWFTKTRSGFDPSQWLEGIPLFGAPQITRAEMPSALTFFEQPRHIQQRLYEENNVFAQLDWADEIGQTIDAFRASAVVSSSELLSGAIAAHRRGMPFATCSLKLTRLFNGHKNALLSAEGARYLAQIVADANLPVELWEGEVFADRLSLISLPTPLLELIAAPAAIATLPASMRVIPFSFVPLRNQTATVVPRPFIYSSFGTSTGAPPRALVENTLLAGLAMGASSVVVACGSLALDRSVPQPANARLVEFADQLVLLREADLFVHHAGLQSVFDGMQCGVPMLAWDFVSPDVHTNRWLMEQVGVGRTISTSLSPDELAAAFREVLADAQMKKRCEHVGSLLRNVSGAAAAAELLVEALGGRS